MSHRSREEWMATVAGKEFHCETKKMFLKEAVVTVTKNEGCTECH